MQAVEKRFSLPLSRAMFAMKEDSQSRGKIVGHVVVVEDTSCPTTGYCCCLHGQLPAMFSDEWARITGKW